MPCKRTSNTRLITTKKPTFQSSKKQIMYTSDSRKRIIKGAKFHLQNFVGLARTPQLYSLFSIMNDVANELLHGGFAYLFIKFLIILFKV